MNRKIDALELRVKERPQPGPIIDVATFQTELAKLQADVDALTAPMEVVLEPTPKLDDDNVVLSVLEDEIPSLDPPCVAGKRIHTSGTTTDPEIEIRATKREKQQLAVAQQQSIINEELRQRRVMELSPS
uniref:Integrase core domain containing protein n=1 Tax=Solanum tuberosum TaxID=4113 RepID=M1DY87_SOLTU